jgi:hypothetical protein
MADNDGIYGLAKKVIPPQARFYTQTLLGDRTKPFTQDDLTTDELRQIHKAVEASRTRLQDRIEQIKNAKSYSDISMSGIYPKHIENNPALKSEKEKFKEFKALNAKHERQLKEGYGNVQYEDYNLTTDLAGLTNPVLNTLGRFTYQIQPDGTVHVSDKYDFYNPSRAKNVEAFEKMAPLEKASAVMKRVEDPLLTEVSTAGGGPTLIKNTMGAIGEAYIGRDGRPVDIKYHPDIFKPQEQAPVGNPMGDAYKKGGMIVKPLAGGRKTI